jgi:hypothetical protein
MEGKPRLERVAKKWGKVKLTSADGGRAEKELAKACSSMRKCGKNFLLRK